MKLARYTPTLNLGRVSDLGPWLRQPLAGLPAMAQLFEDFFPSTTSNRLATDLFEDAENYIARLELPGIKKDVVKVELHERMLTVTAERQEKTGSDESGQTLSRSIVLPDTVKEEVISAKLEDGILTVTLPKQEQRKAKVIAVN